ALRVVDAEGLGRRGARQDEPEHGGERDERAENGSHAGNVVARGPPGQEGGPANPAAGRRPPMCGYPYILRARSGEECANEPARRAPAARFAGLPVWPLWPPRATFPACATHVSRPSSPPPSHC